MENIDGEVLIQRGKYDIYRESRLARALEPVACDFECNEELDRMQYQIDKLTTTCGRLLAMLLVKGQFSLEEINDILEEDIRINP